MKRRKRLSISLILIVTAYILIYLVSKTPEGKQAIIKSSSCSGGKVIVLLADNALLEELKDCPNISSLMNKSFIALVSNRLTGTPSLHKSRLAYASGGRLEIDAGMLHAGILHAEGGANSSSKYYTNTGISIGAENLAYLDINALKSRNSQNGNRDKIGIIGDYLHSENEKTCVIGNSDGVRTDRSAVLMAMDGSGLVDYGDIDDILLQDDSFPGGKRTDYDKLAKLYKQFLPACSLLVIDTGDLNRLEQYRRNLTEGRYRYYRKLSLQNIDMLAGDITQNAGNVTLAIVSTYPAKTAINKTGELAPIIIHTQDEQGLLFSKSTRREGIITNIDFAGYLLNKLNRTADSAVLEAPRADSYSYISALNRQTAAVSALRPPVLKACALFEIFTLLGVLLLFLFNKTAGGAACTKAAKIMLLANLFAPAVLLYSSFIKTGNVWVLIIIAFAAAAAMSTAAYAIFSDSRQCFIFAAFAATSGLTADVLAGSPFIRQSVFGYDPIIGARFYGIGNELAGIYIGSSLLLIGCILDSAKGTSYEKLARRLSVPLMLLFSAVVGMPFWGANFGGAIAALTGYFFMYILVKGVKRNMKIFWSYIAAVAIFAVLITVTDLLDGNSYTHIGKMAAAVRDNGIGPLYLAAAGKISMNLRLIRYTIWTKVLLCVIAAAAVLFYKPAGLLKKVLKNNPQLKNSWASITAASIAGLLANDSGIVLAATSMIYLGCTMLYICLETANGSGNNT